MNTSAEVMASLNTDVSMEHGAILQYLIHGAQLRDSHLGDLVRRTAREEMWHLEWLAEAIRARGGTLGLDRADIFTSASITESIGADVLTEDAALQHYAITLGLIGDSDPELTALIERIVDDEKHHRAAFAALAQRVAVDGDDALAATPAIEPQDLAVAGPVVGTEYGSALQYLWNKYGVGDCDAGEAYFDLAVDEMHHLLWAALYTAGFGKPQAPPTPDWVGLPVSGDDALIRADELEKRAESFYAGKVGEAANPDLKADLERAAGQHGYHRYLLSNMAGGSSRPGTSSPPTAD